MCKAGERVAPVTVSCDDSIWEPGSMPDTNFSLRLHYLWEAGKEGDAEAIPFEPA